MGARTPLVDLVASMLDRAPVELVGLPGVGKSWIARAVARRRPVVVEDPGGTSPARPGTLHPGTLHPGTLHPGTLHPGTLHPGTLHPGTLHPGTLRVARWPTGTPGVHVVIVPPLAVPPPGASPAVALATPAGALYGELLRQAGRDPLREVGLAEAVRGTYGLPGRIEAAVARDTGAAPPRAHRVGGADGELPAAVAALAVFAGEVPLTDLRGVLGDEHLMALGWLLPAGVLRPGEGGRFGVVPTLRPWLAPTEAPPAVVRAHRAWYVRKVLAHLMRPEALREDQAELERALGAALAAGAAEDAAILCTGLLGSGYGEDASAPPALLHEVLGLDPPPAWRSRIQAWSLGVRAGRGEDVGAGVAELRATLADVRDPEARRFGMSTLVRLHLLRHELPEAEDAAGRAVLLAERCADPRELGRALGDLAMVHGARGRLREAVDVAERALDLLDRSGDDTHAARVLCLLAGFDLERRHPDSAARRMAAGLRRAARTPNKRLQAMVEVTCGEVAGRTGREAAAVGHLREGLALSTQVGDRLTALRATQLLSRLGLAA